MSRTSSSSLDNVSLLLIYYIHMCSHRRVHRTAFSTMAIERGAHPFPSLSLSLPPPSLPFFLFPSFSPASYYLLESVYKEIGDNFLIALSVLTVAVPFLLSSGYRSGARRALIISAYYKRFIVRATHAARARAN